MTQVKAFQTLGDTIALTIDENSPALGVQALVELQNVGLAGNYRIVNDGDVTVFLGIGSTAEIAQANASPPVTGMPSSAIPMVGGAVEILSFSEAAYFSGVAGGESTVYITPGLGL